MFYSFLKDALYQYYDYCYPVTLNINRKYKKKQIPKAIREQVWIKYIGKYYQNKCTISWCTNKIDVFNFQAGHNIPESKGGDISLNNLRPICVRCNLSMGNKYTINEWEKLNDSNNNYCQIM